MERIQHIPKIEFSTGKNQYTYLLDSRAGFLSSRIAGKVDYLARCGFIKNDRYFEQHEVTKEDVQYNVFSQGLNELVLDVTTQCNLRCKYCVFGGGYEGARHHSNDFMTESVAQKAIDWYFKYLEKGRFYNVGRKPVIAFYGGEPLLNFSLIKFCISYINQKYGQWKTYYTLTSNGTLLTDEIISYLVQEDVLIILSLDGPKHEHDRNRVFQSGKGTFDVIEKNIDKIYELTRSPIFVTSVYDYKTNLLSLAHFFDESNKLYCVNVVPVKSYGTNYYNQFTPEDLQEFQTHEAELVQYFKDSVVGNYNTSQSFANRYFLDSGVNFYINRVDIESDSSRRLIKTCSCCVPGNKISVTVDGTFYMCEKVNRNFPIGNIETGLNFDQIADVTNKIIKSLYGCSSCDFRNSCGNCQLFFERSDGFFVDPTQCKAYKSYFAAKLKFAYEVLERYPAWAQYCVTRYYQDLGEIGVRLK